MAKKKNNDLHQKMLFDGERIIPKTMEDCLHESMIPYAKHVILERALPRIEDGLKPVQRRILYAMYELNLMPDKPHRKSARIVGDCLGKYHPHGDSSVYEAMVRMAQPFIMRVPLVDGHGNFGSVDGDTAAAMRYTEVRMQPLALEMLRDIEKDTVRFELNFDDTLKEPVVLPGRFPNLLVNGASGIAVGLATCIPPHNLKEAIDACIAVMINPDIELSEIMKIMPCPDFPTGGYLLKSDEIKRAYETGRGKMLVRAKAHFEPQKNGKTLIIFTELPYQVNKAAMLTKILAISQKKRDSLKAFAQITDIRDESDRLGMRAVIEIKKDADPEKVLAALYKYTDLQVTFGANMVVIADGKPRQMGIIEIIKGYLKHQEDVVTRRTKFMLEAAQKREHILDGLVTAIINIDEVIALIRASKTPKEAKESLMAHFKFTEVQAQAILDLRLQRLTNLELVSIQQEAKEVKQQIAEYKKILSSRGDLLSVIRSEMEVIRDKYATPRMTKLINCDEVADIDVDEPIVKVSDDVCVEVYVSEDEHTGFEDVKLARHPLGQVNIDDSGEVPKYTFDSKTDRHLKMFTNNGSCITIAIDDIPEQQKTKNKMRATRLASLIPVENGEKIVAAFMCDLTEENDCDYFFYTKHGNVKRTAFVEYRTKKQRITAINLKDNDEVINVELVSNATMIAKTILLISHNGMSIRFGADSVPVMGRAGAGVKSVKLDIGDSVIFATQIHDNGHVLVVTDRGYAKRTCVFDYDIQGRNGKGLKTIDFKKNGSNGTCLIAALYIEKGMCDIEVVQTHGTKTVINSESVFIERRASTGRVAVVSVLDDVVVSAKELITTFGEN